MKPWTIFLLAGLVLAGCSTSNELPPVSKIKPTVAKDQSLGNDKLISDVTKGIESLEGGISIDPKTKIAKFVIQKPRGSEGSRAWREFWVVDPKGAPLKYMITFKEDGYNAANFNIKKM